MAQYDVIIIGAGPNGLTTAAYLARAGAKVLILERRHETGGGLMTEEFAGFRFNLHAYYMMMMDVMPPYTDLDLEAMGCMYTHHAAPISLLTKDGRSLTLYSDVDASVESIKEISAKDANTFREVYMECKSLADECLIPATYTMPLPAVDLAYEYDKSDIGKRVLTISDMTPTELIDEWGFENPLVKTLISYLPFMWGLDPNVGGVTYMVPLLINRMLNVSTIKGGSHRLSSAIQKVARRSQAEVLETHEVTKIIVEDGVATAVEAVPTGVEGPKVTFEAKAIVTSTDPVTTFSQLIPEEVVAGISKGTAQTAHRWEWEHSSLFGLHLGLREAPRFKAEEANDALKKSLIKVIGFEDQEEVLNHIEGLRGGELSDAGHVTIPTEWDPFQAPIEANPGSAVVRFETMAPYEPNEGSWEEIAEDYGNRLIGKLKDYTLNFDESKIVRKYEYSPAYIEQKLVNMKKGSFKHGAYITTQMGFLRPNISCSSYKTPIKNLYLCGASTYPGGMILLGSGYNAAGVVAQNLGLDVWWTEPEYIEQARQKGLVA